MVAISVAAIGCGQPAPQPVSGRVTLDAKPLSEAVIVFVPLDDGRKKTGGQIIDGNYQLPADVGLLPGKYRVEIADNPPLSSAHGESGNRTAARRAFPHRYAHDSPLTVEYQGAEQATFDFDLYSNPTKQ